MLQNSHHAAQREKVGERVVQVFSLLFFCCFYACFQFPNQTFNACPQCNNSLDFHYLDVTLINLLIILCFVLFSFFISPFPRLANCCLPAPASAVTNVKWFFCILLLFITSLFCQAYHAAYMHMCVCCCCCRTWCCVARFYGDFYEATQQMMGRTHKNWS